MLDVVFLHAIVASTCFYDVYMKYLHARVGGLNGRILEIVLLAYMFPWLLDRKSVV